MSWYNKNEQYEKALAELAKKGIRIKTNACGCCGSPWVKLEIDGVLLFDDEDVIIDMFEEVTE